MKAFTESMVTVFASLAAAALITACGTAAKHSSGTNPKFGAPDDRGSSGNTTVEMRLREEYNKWQGMRHRMGGNGDGGVDCSGFVKTVYKDVFGVDLPRTTLAQARLGRPVALQEIRAGDLVFFKPPTYPRHVGIFLNGSEFMHASKGSGVTVSRIDKYYWGKYYWTARRILPVLE